MRKQAVAVAANLAPAWPWVEAGQLAAAHPLALEDVTWSNQWVT
jgi:hypothetical protein